MSFRANLVTDCQIVSRIVVASISIALWLFKVNNVHKAIQFGLAPHQEQFCNFYVYADCI